MPLYTFLDPTKSTVSLHLLINELRGTIKLITHFNARDSFENRIPIMDGSVKGKTAREAVEKELKEFKANIRLHGLIIATVDSHGFGGCSDDG